MKEGGEDWIWVDRIKENEGGRRGLDMIKENEGGRRGLDIGGQD